MKRLYLTTFGLLCAVASTEAWGEDSSVASIAQPRPVKPHVAKTVALASAGSKSSIFSNPYAPPIGPHKLMMAQFPAIRSEPANPPLGSLTIGVGRDSPDSPFTGGFKLRF
jgi:hypothetical protein